MARCGGEPVQSVLSRALDRFELAILSPVLDSLLRFYEIALGRRIVVGHGAGPSDDERLLQDLIAGRALSNDCLNCEKRARSDFQCALCSARIMLRLACADRTGLAR
ncbi:hypothetical protein F9288_13310 [Sphingomonas sp. CL5.1]|uniref:hypothetical protein n=1 Tax=Sphingomonas sp. CL5.1 TaxID=2653203 RepID=UPI00158161EC|nr:hypothetical protein [Sphingomonas sp. CL5.1]QKS00487.1 hypothetical protein F9288_13310 [Sphingomonas sp. CL5.1]